MTDQELQQLAREYAEQNPPQGVSDEVLKKNCISLNAEVFEKFLVWLAETHCIVSRDKVKEQYTESELFVSGLTVGSYEYGYFLGKNTVLSMLFGESTFKERKENDNAATEED